MNKHRMNLNEILKSPKLPSAPGVALRLLELTRDPNSTAQELATTINSDPALATKILRSANSSLFNFRAEVTTVDRAVRLLGSTVINSLALSFSLASEAMDDPVMAEQYQRYWLRSATLAASAESLASGVGKDASNLFVAGLLVDLGQLAMLKVFREKYASLLDECASNAVRQCELEIERIGCSHIEVGVALMENWKLPLAFVEATRYHHSHPDSLPRVLSTDRLIQSTIVASVAAEYILGGKSECTLPHLRALTECYFQWSETEMLSYLDRANQRARQAAELLSAKADELPSAADLLAQATEQLAAIAIRQDREKQQVVSQQLIAEKQRTELEIQNKQLRQQAFRDPLTGVFNRRYFEDAMDAETRRAERTVGTVAVLFVDVDHFKSLNDTFGHACGDACLVQLADILLKCVRSTDIVARYGGEEFVILALDASESGLTTLAERIRNSVAETKLSHRENQHMITVSIGGAIAIPDRVNRNFRQCLMETADAAMYESKRNGRNRVSIRSMVSEFDQRVAQLVLAHRFSHWLVQNNIIDAAEAYEIAQAARPQPEFIGELAVRRQWLTSDQVQYILGTQQNALERFGEVAFDLGILTEEQVAVLLAEQIEDSQRISEYLVSHGRVLPAEAVTLLNAFQDARQLRLSGLHSQCEPDVLARGLSQ